MTQSRNRLASRGARVRSQAKLELPEVKHQQQAITIFAISQTTLMMGDQQQAETQTEFGSGVQRCR
ncbi:hypothetical protein AVDCRST_MAG81-1205 [uncultured Synechococcales cyanobacterium]|uniref:Uncharacterized protein n=1 Tax=uncultured Synechococcales cyanobacterium TaxID=1936017 RepID=A0A6J4V6J9_9CYAN|nr:hypothetical protein AVDCRST_MAG81-1205 [uncultured Synechococcales cyanobacterium]